MGPKAADILSLPFLPLPRPLPEPSEGVVGVVPFASMFIFISMVRESAALTGLDGPAAMGPPKEVGGASKGKGAASPSGAKSNGNQASFPLLPPFPATADCTRSMLFSMLGSRALCTSQSRSSPSPCSGNLSNTFAPLNSCMNCWAFLAVRKFRNRKPRFASLLGSPGRKRKSKAPLYSLAKTSTTFWRVQDVGTPRSIIAVSEVAEGNTPPSVQGGTPKGGGNGGYIMGPYGGGIM
mmetsp:Transcript_81214/g.181721  ORF Transcript_81214/g.181721 Transcript_81214/m.181721 type:complete len:237 (-) Transcript_81214:1236-1946(-)